MKVRCVTAVLRTSVHSYFIGAFAAERGVRRHRTTFPINSWCRSCTSQRAQRWHDNLLLSEAMGDTWIEITPMLALVFGALFGFGAFTADANKWKSAKVRTICGIIFGAAFASTMLGHFVGAEHSPDCSTILQREGEPTRLQMLERECKQENSDTNWEWTKALFVLFSISAVIGVRTGSRAMTMDQALKIVSETSGKVSRAESIKGSFSDFEIASAKLQTLPLSEEYRSNLRAMTVIVQMDGR